MKCVGQFFLSFPISSAGSCAATLGGGVVAWDQVIPGLIRNVARKMLRIKCFLGPQEWPFARCTLEVFRRFAFGCSLLITFSMYWLAWISVCRVVMLILVRSSGGSVCSTA